MDGLAALVYEPETRAPLEQPDRGCAFLGVIAEICTLRWEALGSDDMLRVAQAYYYFSIQFRENLEIACRLRPGDAKLRELHRGECDTDNLSPWPGVAEPGERMDHDEFMRRALALRPINDGGYLAKLGQRYLDRVRQIPDLARAASIASYEDGGLSSVFAAMLRAPHWDGAPQRAFRFFLEQHIKFDTDDAGGHGSLSRHLAPTDAVLPLWTAFREMLSAAAPRLVAAAARG